MSRITGPADNLDHLYITVTGKLKDDRMNDYYILGMIEVDRPKGKGGGKEILPIVRTEPYVQ